MEAEALKVEREPTIKVGVVSEVESLAFELMGNGWVADGRVLPQGAYNVELRGQTPRLTGSGVEIDFAGNEFLLRPCPGSGPCSLSVKDVQIGIGFHWQRNEDQKFGGQFRPICTSSGKLSLINIVPIEDYLTSVIASEMNGNAHPELLKAHAITSRSWLLAQLQPWKVLRREARSEDSALKPEDSVRWYDRENHPDFDVCADDHCQRYQGMTKATTGAAGDAISQTFGQVLTFEGQICDARYSKSCGGVTEDYRAAWEDVSIPYLSSGYDGDEWPTAFRSPLSAEANAAAWILKHPPAFCNSNDRTILDKILPDFDRETEDFFRWRVEIEQDTIQSLLRSKLNLDVGPVLSFDVAERGRSGRIIRLRVHGERGSVTIGKELEIRRALSQSHLYSSALVIQPGVATNGVPASFTIVGAGWGHGVGLCQIGAAVMAERGFESTAILHHYFSGARIDRLYSKGHRRT